MVNPTKAEIIKAAKLIVLGIHKYTCVALFDCTKARKFGQEYAKFLDYPDGVSWFGSAKRSKNQLARSLALLLYAEARKDVL